jgi:hypothetical protein
MVGPSGVAGGSTLDNIGTVNSLGECRVAMTDSTVIQGARHVRGSAARCSRQVACDG